MPYHTEYDSTRRLLCGWLTAQAEPSFTPAILTAANQYDADLPVDTQRQLHTPDRWPVDCYLWASAHPLAFSLGGDLGHFVRCIEQREWEALMNYARQCVNIVYRRLNHYGASGLLTITLVQGAALGGGLEAALASDVIIAEEQATFGFPEIRFNLFPGMGGYSMLKRRIGDAATMKMMTSGKVYGAAECQALGFVDEVVPTGTGRQAADSYLDRIEPWFNGLSALFTARREAVRIPHRELLNITTEWVRAASRLPPKDLDYMRGLVRAQRRYRDEQSH
ncbi:crotonase/enoyl-CoA hydratase family protein [Pseudomonas eucalypticola]|uniref:Enoyl-CoA hydratase/isomerase family protein n=1 Tax=Pseudomonas eucalypticola TaxID=2599595 RepID=A0A7D5H5Y6_9PSED|nr:crotonase/enoyl-CoA hydratase family protein [Pseudomonas eucalypticola]QKZ04703.1 enoyl-CoA hydratase/isomerase family protein [Pseudomonas eucalypticola]